MKYKRYSLVVLSLFLILFLFIASASAAGTNETDELAADDSTSTVIEKLASDSSSVYNKSDDSNDFRNYGDDLLSADDSANSEIYKHDGSQEVLKADNTWYVDANAASGGDGSQESPFNSLKAVLEGRSAGDVIRIAPGTYSGVNNTGLTIGKILTFEKYGDGEVIFDGQANNNIWTVSANSINIYGLTFINGNATGKGGAIYVTGDISNSVVNATFINNTANSDSFSYGGAVCFNGKVTDLTLNSVFINNAADLGGAVCFLGTGDNVNVYGEFRNNTAESVGGAIRFERQLKNSNINATFINNKATDGGGGAVQAAYDAENVSVYGEFRNNVAKYGGAIYFAGPNNIIFNIININATFTDNTASRYGGAIYIVNEVSNLAINSTFIHNTATNEGGAVQFLGTVSSSNINSKFINNTAGYGGANYFNRLNNVNITGDFINNRATESGNYRGGSANYFNKAVTNVHISGNFISNTIKGSSLTHNEATNYFKETATNVDISGKFINNTGHRLIFFASTGGSNVIHDSIFLNNQVSTVINNVGRVTARNNWFGNNASNYDKTPANVGINLASWLFLNATADPGEIILDENSTIIFKLQSYDRSSIGDYDASKMNITLALSQTLGQLDKTASSIGEEITYTVKKDGNAGVTAKYETASYTLSLTNLKIPVTIDVANSTVDLKVNGKTDIGATLTPADAGNLTYTSSNTSVARVENGTIKALSEGNANITVSYAGNDRYAAVSKIIEVTVTLNDAQVSVNNATLDLVAGEKFDIVATTIPDGLNVTYVADNSGVISVDENGTLTALKGGNATVTVSVGGDGVYALNTTEITVTVRKAPTEITVSNSTFDLKVKEVINSGATLTPADAGNLTYTSSNSSVVIIENGKIKAVGAGSANITVSFKGNEKYLASENRTIGVNVTLNDASLSVNNVTLDLIIDDTFDLVAVTSPEGLNVTFEADDSGVVSVDENGTVTALKRGKATVIVSVGGDGVYALNTTEVNVTVSRIHPVISATDTIDLKVNDTVDLNANLNYPDDIKLNFTSSNENVVRVNDTGMITAVGKGRAYITVSFAGNERYTAAENKIIIVTVSKIPTSIKIYDDHVEAYVDSEHMTSADLIPYEAGDLHYESSDTNVVDVDYLSGLIMANHEGSAQIIVSFPGNGKYEASEGIIYVTVIRHETSIDVVDKLDMKVGGMVGLNATLNPSEAGSLDYSSSNESVVVVNRSGEVTAVGAGSAIITVSFNGDYYYADVSKDIIVTVSKVDTSIDVADKVEMTVGDVINVNATLTPGEAGELNYSSSDESVVTVSDDGEISAVGTGSAIVTVSFAGNAKYSSAESKNVLVVVGKVDVVISAVDNVSMNVGDKVNINATLTPGEAGGLNYTSSDEGVVSVNGDGEITAVGTGSAIVTVSFTGNANYSSAESKNVLVVVGKVDVVISAVDNVSMNVGDKVNINATLTPGGAGELIYTSSDVGVVTVSDDGEISAVGAGSAIVSVSFAGNDRYEAVSKSVLVVVGKVDVVISAVDNVSMNVGDKVNINATLTPLEAGALNFTSSDESVVTVNDNGEVTAVGGGNAYITVSFKGNDKYNSQSKIIEVNVVKKDTSISAVSNVEGYTVSIVSSVDENSTGYVTVAILGQTFLTVVENGKAEFKYDFAPGTYSAVVTYRGDGNFNNASTNVTFTVIEHHEDLKNTTIDVNVTALENDVTITATVDSAASGLIEFNINGESVYIPVNNGKSIYNLVLPAGNYTVRATYMGDDKFNSNSTSRQFTVTDHVKENTTIVSKVTVDKNNVEITVTVNENATGFVKFTTNDGDIFAEVKGGKAIVKTYLPAGNYTIVAEYLGDDDFNVNTSEVNFTVDEKTLKDTAVDVDIKIDENNITITASVDENATGLVRFEIAGAGEYTLYGEVEKGKAVIEDVLEAGDYTLRVTYMGDENFNMNSTDETFNITGHVKKDTAISAISNVDKGTVSITVSLDRNATGYVTLAILGQNFLLPVNDGEALFTYDFATGTYSANIVYLGDDNFNNASTNVTFTVIEHHEDLKNTTIDVNVTALENDVTITATVDSAASGLIEFNINGESLYIPVNNGKSIYNLALPAGNYTVRATYMGNDKFNSNSTSRQFTVTDHVKENTTIVSEVTVDKNNVEIRVTVNENATGFVKFTTNDGDIFAEVKGGKAIVKTYLPAGNYTIAAEYLGDDDFNVNTTEVNFTVDEKTLKDTPVDVDIQIDENNITITASVDENATGLVRFEIAGAGEYTLYGEVEKGKAVIEDVLEAGDYTLRVTYMGDENFNMNSTDETFNITGHVKKDTAIYAIPNVDKGTVSITVSLDRNATGYVTLAILGQTFLLPVNDGEALFTYDFTNGTYSANIVYLGDDNFNNASTTASFSVINESSELKNTTIDVNVTTFENDVTITAAVDTSASGLIGFTLGGNAVYLPVNNGVAVYEVSLPAGDYNVEVTYLGSDKFNANRTSASFTVAGHIKQNTTIAPEVKVDNNNVEITVTVNENATGFVRFTNAASEIFGEVKNGKAIVNVILPAGNYTVSLTYLGDDEFNANETEISFSVDSP